jgi:hypothetical protein
MYVVVVVSLLVLLPLLPLLHWCSIVAAFFKL